MKLDRPLLIGTQHKAGTLLMELIFEAVARRLGLRFVVDYDAALRPQADIDIYFSGQTAFHNDWRKKKEDFAGFRVIRDPRDLMISGAHYHIRAEESWLDQPMKDGFSLTYRKLLLNQRSWRARYLTEMLHVARISSTYMADFVQRPHCMRQDVLSTVRLEDLNASTGLDTLQATMKSLELPPLFIEAASEEFEANSLERVRRTHADHITSEKSGPRWPALFDQMMGNFVDHHLGEALQVLSYIDHRDWYFELPAYNADLDDLIT